MTAPDRIQITHQPRTMTTPDFRAELQRLVQAYDEHGGRWPEHDERALFDAVEAARAALQAEPEGEGPSEKDLYDLAAEFNGDPVPAMRRALEVWGNPLQGAPAPGENPATPPAPEPREVGELHPLWYLVEFLEGHSSFRRQTEPMDELAQILSDSVTLLQQQVTELAVLRGVPVAWCLSDEFENAMKRGGSFNGWKDPGAGANKCDMRLYAIPLPAPQAGEVEA